MPHRGKYPNEKNKKLLLGSKLKNDRSSGTFSSLYYNVLGSEYVTEGKRSGTVMLSVKLGEDRPSLPGLDSPLQMVPSLTVDGLPLTEDEISELLCQTEGLAFLKGKWIEVDHEKLRALLSQMKQNHGEIPLLQALRAGLSGNSENDLAEDGPVVTNGKWLSELLQSLRSP